MSEEGGASSGPPSGPPGPPQSGGPPLNQGGPPHHQAGPPQSGGPLHLSFMHTEIFNPIFKNVFNLALGCTYSTLFSFLVEDFVHIMV